MSVAAFFDRGMASKRIKDGITHFLGLYLSGAGGVAEDIASAEAVIDDFFDGRFDLHGFFFEAEGKAEQQGGGEDLCDGVGDAHAGNVRSSAAAGLEEAKVEAVTLRLAEAGAGEHAKRASDHGHFIAQNVAKEVFGDEDVEAARSFDELHGGIVHVEVCQRHVRVLLGDFDHRFAPEDGVGEHIGLVHAGDVLAAKLRGLEGDVGDAHDLALLVNHGVDDLDVAIGQCGAALRLAEVHAAGQFTHAEHVKAALDEVGTNGRGTGERGIADAGAQIGEEAEVLANGQECTALGLLIRRELFPLRAADGAEEDGVAGFAGFDGFFRQRLAHGVDGGTTDEFVVIVEREAGTAGDGVEDAKGLGHDFWADAVAGEDCEVVGFGHVDWESES